MMIISYEEPPNIKHFDSEEDYQKAFEEWKEVFDSILEKHGNIGGS